MVYFVELFLYGEFILAIKHTGHFRCCDEGCCATGMSTSHVLLVANTSHFLSVHTCDVDGTCVIQSLLVNARPFMGSLHRHPSEMGFGISMQGPVEEGKLLLRSQREALAFRGRGFPWWRLCCIQDPASLWMGAAHVLRCRVVCIFEVASLFLTLCWDLMSMAWEPCPAPLPPVGMRFPLRL